MLLAIDAGNTNIVFGLRLAAADANADADSMRFISWRMATNVHATQDDYASWLAFHLNQKNQAKKHGWQFADIDGVIVSSVVPQLLPPLSQFITQHISAPLYTLAPSDPSHGISIKIDKPHQAGCDRIANAAAASLYTLPAIVIDFGTATTFDYIDGDGAYAGGVIAPGVNLSVAALYKAAAQLPMLDSDEWTQDMPIIGTTTRTAMNSGLFYGYISLIEGILGRIKKSIASKNITVIATGGLGEMFAKAIPAIECYDVDLTLKGLGIIYDRQAEKQGNRP